MVMKKKNEAGYNLVILVVAITVLNILVAAAIPLWRTAIKREKEEELISRGFQYAEAIRVFQHRYGRMPARLEELMEVKPRCIRRLWADPITGKQDWVPIRVGTPGAVDPNAPNGNDDGRGGGEGKDPDDENGGEDESADLQPAAQRDPGTNTPDGSVGLGPIRGVHSRSKAEAIKMMFGQDRYDQWQFTVELLQSGGIVNVGGAGVPAAAGPRLSAKWIGRPFRPGLQQPGLQQQDLRRSANP
jgi:type II secretory pathway pseudopilin PulG